MKIIDALKKFDKELEKYGMSDENIVELFGEENIHESNLEDLQWIIDKAHAEEQALLRECAEEFGFAL